jgi:hypothetical protein
VILAPELVLLGAVISVGVLHTLVPDHWVPIAVLARNFRWTRAQTAWAAAIAGLGHTLSTLAVGIVVWLAGLALAVRFGNLVSILAGIALVAFGLWIAGASLLEMHANSKLDHLDKIDESSQRSLRMTMLLILGSSPMVEGIPAFFAAARFGAGLLAAMALCFAISTIATYVAMCLGSHAALQSLSFGPLERSGEVLSGTIIAIVGFVFLVWSSV